MATLHRQPFTDRSDAVLMQALTAFQHHFNSSADLHVGLAPGRVNVIGDHTDYNHGFVLPMAVQYHCVVVAKPNNSNTWRLYSVNNDEVEEEDNRVQLFDEQQFYAVPSNNSNSDDDTHHWHDYMRGTIAQYKADPATAAIPACDVVVCGNVPLGAGLSSSASLEVATAMMIESLLQLNTDSNTIAKRCQQAEHVYANVPCGLMDQIVSTAAESSHLMLLDCRSCGFQLVAFVDPAVTVLVINSNIKHELGSSEYAIRRKQCDAAVAVIKHIQPSVQTLRDVDMELLQSAQQLMDEVCFYRARHVLTENQRVLATATAVHEKNWKFVGMLMTNSHVSLKNDYEVSCDAVDVLVNIALTQSGVYGARMTGGGFGGCVVVLVETDKLEAVREEILAAYMQETEIEATAYVMTPSGGASHMRI